MKDFISLGKGLSKNKFFELQLSYIKKLFYSTSFKFDLFNYIYYFRLQFSFIFFDFDIVWTRKTDHAGFNFTLELFGLFFSTSIYDCRHWDGENDSWEIYEDNLKQSDKISTKI